MTPHRSAYAPDQAAPTRTKPIRITVDMTPAQHRRLKEFKGRAADELEMADIPAAAIIRALVHRLTLTRRDEDYDPAVDRLVESVIEDLRRSHGSRA